LDLFEPVSCYFYSRRQYFCENVLF